jgi:hypothetical protein
MGLHVGAAAHGYVHLTQGQVNDFSLCDVCLSHSLLTAGVVPVYLTYMQRGPAGTMVCTSVARCAAPGVATFSSISQLITRRSTYCKRAAVTPIECPGSTLPSSRTTCLPSASPPTTCGYPATFRRRATSRRCAPRPAQTSPGPLPHGLWGNAVLTLPRRASPGDHPQTFGSGFARVEGQRAQEVAPLHRQHQ